MVDVCGDAGLSSGLMKKIMNNQFKKLSGLVIGLFYLIILLLAGCEQRVTKVNNGAALPAEASPVIETDTQLKVNQEALLRGANDAVRIDAATVMLFGDSPRARQVLIDTLKQTENKPAKIAVCRALIVSRETRREVPNKRDFIEPLIEVLKTEDISVARYASEAALLFEYDTIRNMLESMAGDAAMPTRARLNAIYAMKMQMDVRR